MLNIPFDNSYARLPEGFFAPQPPTPVPEPRLLELNEPLAVELGLDPAELRAPDGVAMLAGNAFPENAAAIATAYAGHQFGHFVPQLGDGRALLIGEVIGRDGKRRDLQLKGSGPTPFSRNGDGRAALGPVLREYLVSEAMHALGIPTTRALSAVATGEYVFREAALPGAVLCRVASSHIRVGTFQFFAARGDVERVRALAAHSIERHHPEAAEAENPHLALLSAVVSAQARLVAQWMLVGFVHGVMNTDNCSVAGETIDYGPCAFLDAYDPATVFSSIDQMGRYAFGMQPRIALWNCTRLAEALLPLLGADEDAAIAAAQAALGAFGPQFDAAHGLGLRRKLGLVEAQEGDAALAGDLLSRMAENRADFTLAFRTLADLGDGAGPGPRHLFADPAAFDAWLPAWQARCEAEPMDGEARAALMRSGSPAIIPRNHLVEAALEAAVHRNDLAPFRALLDAVSRPFADRPGFGPPAAPAEGYRTFCGT